MTPAPWVSNHFAFVRSFLLGLDLREAFTRYMAWSETTTDLRYVQNRRDALLKQIIESGRNLNLDVSKHAVLLNSLELLHSQAQVPAIVQLPTLE